MIGFHPHGIYPVTVYWATLGRDWRKLNPKIDVTTLGATGNDGDYSYIISYVENQLCFILLS